LSNGFAATEDPTGLQTICDQLGPATIEEFAQRWFAVLPLPLTEHDQASGYWWELSMRQIEVSQTIVFAQPRHARGFFEARVADNLDIGRPGPRLVAQASETAQSLSHRYPIGAGLASRTRPPRALFDLAVPSPDRPS
jgi:hypothetical protein